MTFDYDTTVSGIGDINSDGIHDVAIGSHCASPLGRGYAGTVTVVYGHNTSVAFSDVDPVTYIFGTGGFQIYGANPGDQLASAVASAGDVNGDGIGDMIVGAHYHYFGLGTAYVIFGRTIDNPFNAFLDLATFVSGLDGFKVTGGAPNDFLGWSGSGAGDVYGDGYDDVIIGAQFSEPSVRPGGIGNIYVIFGHSNAVAFTDIATDTLTSGSKGFRINGAEANDGAGWSVSGAGDVNGDGFDDVIAGAPYADPVGRTDAGVSYVVFGHSGAFTDIDLLSFTPGASGFKIVGAAVDGRSGSSVSGAGDVNSDGIDDVIVGAPNVGDGNGEAYVIFSTGGVLAFADVDLSTMVYGTLGFRI